MRKPAGIDYASRIQASPDELLDWHSRPGALLRLMPPWERVEVLQEAAGLGEGNRARLRVRVAGFSRELAFEHRSLGEGLGFADVLADSKSLSWRHAHRFDPVPGGSVMIDRIEFRIRGLPLCDPVARRIRRALRYRHETLRGDFAALARYGNAPRMRIGVTGASGLIGRTLVPYLRTQGHTVFRLVRRLPRAGDEIRWEPSGGGTDPQSLAKCDAVVHLAGENLAAGRWTAERKRRILESRAVGTRRLVEAMRSARPAPAVLVSASGINFHGDRGDEELTEESPQGRGFLASVCGAWEAEARRAGESGIRAVQLRFGMVLSPGGGALGKMLPAFRLGLGGPLGSGEQWVSWIGIDDLCDIVQEACVDPALAGPVIAAAPEPVRQRDFARVLAGVLRRPAAMRVPACALRAAFGGLADETLLASTRGIPAGLLDRGHPFRHPALEAALRHVLGIAEATGS